jgi:hypothetical protein
MARQKEERKRSLPGFGRSTAATTPGEGEDEVVSESVPSPPSWYVWEYDAGNDRCAFRGDVVTQRLVADNIFYLTPEQHEVVVAGDDVNVELAKKAK